MDVENKNLTEEVLGQASGGAGLEAAVYQEGDLVSVKADLGYGFGRITSVSYIGEEPIYVVLTDKLATRQGESIVIFNSHITIRILPKHCSSRILKKINDLPPNGEYTKMTLRPWIGFEF